MTTDRTNTASCMPLASRKVPTISVRTLGLLLLSTALAAAAAEAQPREPGRFFEQLDTNGDGVVDGDELTAARRDTFRRADQDDDGFVTGDEIEQLAGVPPERSRPRRGGIVRGVGRGRMPSADALLQRLDADRDGRISEREFVEAENPLLERFDANSDGKIGRDEIERVQQRMRARTEGRRIR